MLLKCNHNSLVKKRTNKYGFKYLKCKECNRVLLNGKDGDGVDERIVLRLLKEDGVSTITFGLNFHQLMPKIKGLEQASLFEIEDLLCDTDFPFVSYLSMVGRNEFVKMVCTLLSDGYYEYTVCDNTYTQYPSDNNRCFVNENGSFVVKLFNGEEALLNREKVIYYLTLTTDHYFSRMSYEEKRISWKKCESELILDSFKSCFFK